MMSDEGLQDRREEGHDFRNKASERTGLGTSGEANGNSIKHNPSRRRLFPYIRHFQHRCNIWPAPGLPPAIPWDSFLPCCWKCQRGRNLKTSQSTGGKLMIQREEIASHPTHLFTSIMQITFPEPDKVIYKSHKRTLASMKSALL